MKKLNLNLSSFLVFFFLNCSFSYSEDVKNIYGKPIVIDGDTINLNNKVIRFSGIDAPESYYRGKEQVCYLNKKKFFCGKLSKKKLKEKIGNELVVCKRERNTDIYGRILAECFIKDESLSKFMVRSGYAFDFTRYSKKKYAEDEIYAKSNKLGIWMMKFEYPWVWRKKINKI